MRWLADVKPRNNLALFIMTAAMLLVPSIGVRAMTANGNTEVKVNLCSDQDQPGLAVGNPKDGDQVTGPFIVVKGNVTDVSTVNFYVDNALSSTLLVGESAIGFEQPLTLQDGKHTIKVIGYDLCQREFKTIVIDLTVTTPKDTTNAAGSNNAGKKSTAQPTPTIFYSATNDTPTNTPRSPSTGQQIVDAGGAAQEAARGLPERVLNWLDIGPETFTIGNTLRSVGAICGVLITSNTVLASQLAQYATMAYAARQAGTKLQRKKLIQKRLPAFRLATHVIGLLLILVTFVV